MSIIEAVLQKRSAERGDIPVIEAVQPVSTPEIAFDQSLQRLRARVQTPPLNAARHQPLSPLLVAAEQPTSAAAEAFRELRSQLLLRWFTGSQSVLAVTSALRSEGCSTVAANLAIAMAQLGERTLLIDANLREPAQHRLFGLTFVAGLAELLSGQELPDQVLVPAPGVENLCVLPAGALPPNPQELVSRGVFASLLKMLTKLFRTIIIDTPAALSYADAQIIAARAQGCLLVTRRHRTGLNEVERIKHRLEPAGAQLVGSVISG